MLKKAKNGEICGKKTMKFRHFVLVSCAVLSCTQEPPPTEPPPPNVIPVEKMVSIIADLQLAESSIGLMPLSHPKAVAHYSKVENQIFKRHQVDSVRYQTSYQYYITQRNTIKKLYNMVMDTLVTRNILLKEKLQKDSLQQTTPKK